MRRSTHLEWRTDGSTRTEVLLLTCFQGSLNDSSDEFTFEPFVQFEILRPTDNAHNQSRLLNIPHIQDELTKLGWVGFDIAAKVAGIRLRQITVGIRACRSRMFLRVPH